MPGIAGIEKVRSEQYVVLWEIADGNVEVLALFDRGLEKEPLGKCQIDVVTPIYAIHT